MISTPCSSSALSIFGFLERFPAELACQDALERARWLDGFVCPRCEHRSARAFRRKGRKMFECRRNPAERPRNPPPRMKWVNTVLGDIKRAIDGCYHSIRY